MRTQLCGLGGRRLLVRGDADRVVRNRRQYRVTLLAAFVVLCAAMIVALPAVAHAVTWSNYNPLAGRDHH